MVQEGLLPCNDLTGCFPMSKTTEDIPPAIAKQHQPSEMTINVVNGQ